MNTIIPIGVLQKDIDIYRRMKVSSDYLNQLRELEGITATLGIGTISLYYCYQMVLKQLENYSYYEATIFQRLEDENYHNTVKLLSEITVPKEKTKVKNIEPSNIVPFSQKNYRFFSIIFLICSKSLISIFSCSPVIIFFKLK